jgi:hypothetical protein
MPDPAATSKAPAQATQAENADTSPEGTDFADETQPPPVDYEEETDAFDNDNGFDAAFDAAFGSEGREATPEQAETNGQTERDASTGIDADGEADVASDEEAPPAEEPAEDRGEETDASEEEAAAEGPDETKASKSPGVDFDALSAELGTRVTSQEDLTEQVRSLQDRADGLTELDQMVRQNEAFGAFTAALMEGKSPQEAAADAVPGVETQAPDPDLDPEGYAEYREQQAREEERARLEEDKQQTQEQLRERGAKSFKRAFNAFVEKQDEDFDEEAFGREYMSLTQIDPDTGRFRPDAFEIVQKGLRHDELIEQAREEARKEGFAEGVRSVKEKRGGKDAPPNLTSSAEAPGETGEGVPDELEGLADTVTNENWWDQN